MTPYIIRARRVAPGRYRAWATVAGRRVTRTYGPPPAPCPLPHLWAVDQLGRTLGLAVDTTPLWGAAALPTLAYQAWA